MKKSIIKKIFLAVFTMFLCLALTSAGCDTISNPSKSPSRPTNPGTTPPVDDDDTDADDLDNEINSDGDPNVTVNKIKFASDVYTLRPNKTYDISKWVETVPAGGVLPADLKIEVETTMLNYAASITGMTLKTYDADLVSYQYPVKATSSKGNANCRITVENPPASMGTSDSNKTPAAVKGTVYVTENRYGGKVDTPWYAIYFIDTRHVRIGMCSVARANAVKLARGANTGTGSSHILEYSFDSGIYDLKGFVRVVGGECVIKGDTLTNYFFENDPQDFVDSKKFGL